MLATSSPKYSDNPSSSDVCPKNPESTEGERREDHLDRRRGVELMRIEEQEAGDR